MRPLPSNIFMKIDLNKIKKIHFIGIGGIGVSAVARMFHLEGKKVSGSEVAPTMVTDELKKLGAKIYAQHSTHNIPKDADLVIYSPAVSENNPELRRARQLKIRTLSYPQALGLISKNKFTIAVAGTHGKTTTTAMIAKILMDAGLDPTVIVGSFLLDQKSNFIAGKSKYFVVEACEYKKSFLNLHPDIAVITNVDNDHLDYYGSMKNLRKAFSDFAKRSKIVILGEKLGARRYKLAAPGEHNQRNANVAFEVAKLLGIRKSVALKSLARFHGTWRRSEFKGKTKKGARVYDDYAHHPTEIRATLAAFRQKFPKKWLCVVFQPHLYSRTKLLLKDFQKSFKDADMVIVTDIYAAREKVDRSIHAKDIVKPMYNGLYVKSFKEIAKVLKGVADSRTVIITLGAGDIYKIWDLLK